MGSRVKGIIGISLILIIIASVMVFGQDLEVLHHFSGSDGQNARGPLLEHDGYLYGVSFRGGSSNSGAIYKIRKDGSGFETLHSFDGSNGQSPNYGGVITDGTWLYGLTSQGGSDFSGTLYRINPDGSNHTVLHHFGRSPEARNPYGAPFLLNNKFYFIVINGGDYGRGAFCRIDKDGSNYQILYHFSTVDDTWLNFAWDGERFYNSSSHGGASGLGAIFAINPDGTGFTILHSFSGGTGDGAIPIYSSPILVGEYLFGLTGNGGPNSTGVIYKIKTDGSEYQIIDTAFSGVFDYYRSASLLFEMGRLYCIANGGGENNLGGVFRFDRSGNGFELLHSFSGELDGSMPRSTPIVTDGYLYGNCYYGGASGVGTLFRIPLAGHISATIFPQAAVNDGAQWRLSFQAGWRDSGKTARDVPEGDYTIVFKPIEGWKKPADQFVTVEKNGFVSATGEYTQKGTELEYGHLKVVLKPIYARKHGAQWSVVGSGEWNDSGDRVKLPVGAARIKFSRVKGYSRPDVAVVQILKNTSTVVKKVYQGK